MTLTYLAKITMPGARELVNWENHDIDFILIRHYECLRVLVNKFKYSLGVQMLTKRGVEHYGSKKYVELMKKKFASSYKFKEMLDEDHEDLVNLEGFRKYFPTEPLCCAKYCFFQQA